MSPAALLQLQQALDEQGTNMLRIANHVTANCGHMDAFSGFLGVFAGQYGEAFDVMSQSLQDGAEGAQLRATAMGLTHDEYAASDQRVQDAMVPLGATASAAQPVVPPGGGMPDIPPPVKGGGEIVNQFLDGDNWPGGDGVGPSNPFNVVPGSGSPTAPLDIYNGIQGLVESGQDTQEATDVNNDADDFNEEHG